MGAGFTDGNLADLVGTFGCTSEDRRADGTVHVHLYLITSNGKGTITGQSADNSNNSTAPTFQPFHPFPAATYCLNTDDTGYLFPNTTAGNTCPKALLLDSGKNQIRLIDSAETRAVADVCTKR